MKTGPLIGLCALTTLASANASADPRAACFDAASQGQTLRDSHKLVEARGAFRTCAQPQCPASMQSDCAGWLEAVDKILPTVVFTAQDGAGHDVLDATVTVDGQVVATQLDGKALRINPGAHTFRVERSGTAAVTESVLISEGEIARRFNVVLANATPPVATQIPAPSAPPNESPPAQASTSTMRTVGWIVGGVGVIGLGTGIALVAVGAAKRSGCSDGGDCPTTTDLDDYNGGTPLLNTGYGLLVAGGVMTAAGLVLWITSPRGPEGRGARGDALDKVRVGLAPAGILVSGAFR